LSAHTPYFAKETINITAPLTADDRVLTRILRTEKPFNAYQVMRKFPSRKWKKWGLFDKNNDTTGLSDSLTALRSHHTVGYLNANVPKFIEPENWPPTRPDLNPVDYYI